MLPEAFENRMKYMLGDEYEKFETSFENKKKQGLRLNPLKCCGNDYAKNLNLSSIPWCETGYYFASDKMDASGVTTPGKHPYHQAGVYYIQEPSAMAPVEFLDIKPGMKVLDLCAAPGGKSTQCAGKLMQEGVLVCNEIMPNRSKILSENIERLGVKNALVTNESPADLAKHFEGFFDRILVDSPCSGEGMFRKNEDATTEWSLENVSICAERDQEILEAADKMLSNGGRLVYSTCTFAPAENEGAIALFLARHPEYELVDAFEEMKKIANGERKFGEESLDFSMMSPGRAEWAKDKSLSLIDEEIQEEIFEQLNKTVRLWPHVLDGEGHYLAILKKSNNLGESVKENTFSRKDKKTKKNNSKGKDINELMKKELASIGFENASKIIDEAKVDDRIVSFGEQIYILPVGIKDIKGLKVVRAGLQLGTVKKDRFEPSHALALACDDSYKGNECDLASDSEQVAAFLRGESFEFAGEKGWTLIKVDGYSLGWGKCDGRLMKNHYPKGLRRYS